MSTKKENLVFTICCFPPGRRGLNFIVDEIKKAPDHILDDLKQKCSKKKC